MTVETLPPFPPNENPFHHDDYRMGTPIDNNITIMYEHFENNKYIIVINKSTGKRLKITL